MCATAFEEEPKLGVFLSREVAERQGEILVVTHDADGDWAFLTGKEDAEDADDYVLVCLEHVVEQHPEVLDCADLQRSWHAERDGPGAPWIRGELEDDDRYGAKE